MIAGYENYVGHYPLQEGFGGGELRDELRFIEKRQKKTLEMLFKLYLNFIRTNLGLRKSLDCWFSSEECRKVGQLGKILKERSEEYRMVRRLRIMQELLSA